MSNIMIDDIPELDDVGSVPRRALIVQIQSAGFEGGNYSRIKINGNKVDCFMNENGT